MKKHLAFFLLICFALASQSLLAQPRRGERHDRDYHYAHYSSYPSFTFVAELPRGAVGLSIGNSRYHYYRGLYYRPHERGYIVVAPPVGIIVPALPPDVEVIIVGSRRYYYYEDIYYSPRESGYEVVEKPGDAPAPKTTSSYEKIVIDGKTYYKKDEVYYKAAIDDKGEVMYEKVGQVGK